MSIGMVNTLHVVPISVIAQTTQIYRPTAQIFYFWKYLEKEEYV